MRLWAIVAKRPKPALEIDLLLAEERGINESLGDLKVDRRP
jgi:hypothetical protein